MIDKDWLFTSSDYICDLRTVAVLVKNEIHNLNEPMKRIWDNWCTFLEWNCFATRNDIE